MSIKNLTLSVACLAALLLSSGCAGDLFGQKETMLDRNWGRSYESVKFNQMLNLEAGKNLEPVTGLDGETAQKNINKTRTCGPKTAKGKEFGILTIKSK